MKPIENLMGKAINKYELSNAIFNAGFAKNIKIFFWGHYGVLKYKKGIWEFWYDNFAQIHELSLKDVKCLSR